MTLKVFIDCSIDSATGLHFLENLTWLPFGIDYNHYYDDDDVCIETRAIRMELGLGENCSVFSF